MCWIYVNDIRCLYFIYTTNRGSGFLRFKLDRFSQLLYTSNPTEDTRIRHFESMGFTIPQAIEEYMKEQDSSNNKMAS